MAVLSGRDRRALWVDVGRGVAIVAMVASHLFTIVEGVAFPELFNLAEHLSLLAASVLFFVGTVRYFLGSDGWTV